MRQGRLCCEAVQPRRQRDTGVVLLVGPEPFVMSVDAPMRLRRIKVNNGKESPGLQNTVGFRHGRQEMMPVDEVQAEPEEEQVGGFVCERQTLGGSAHQGHRLVELNRHSIAVCHRACGRFDTGTLATECGAQLHEFSSVAAANFGRVSNRGVGCPQELDQPAGGWPIAVRQKRLRLNSSDWVLRFGRLSLLKRFGPGMMDSLNYSVVCDGFKVKAWI